LNLCLVGIDADCELVAQMKLDSEWGKTIFDGLITLGAVYFGAWLAFRHERKKAEADERLKVREAERQEFQSRAAAVNLTMLSLSQITAVLRKLRKDAIDPFRSDEDRWWKMPLATLEAEVVLPIDYPALQFLFKSKNPNILAELAAQERRFSGVRTLASRHAIMHATEFQPIIEKLGLSEPYEFERVRRAAGPRIRNSLRDYANGLAKLVDEGVAAGEKLQKELRNLAAPMVGDEVLIWVIPDVVGKPIGEAIKELNEARGVTKAPKDGGDRR
jgi:hypothetical protein